MCATRTSAGRAAAAANTSSSAALLSCATSSTTWGLLSAPLVRRFFCLADEAAPWRASVSAATRVRTQQEGGCVYLHGGPSSSRALRPCQTYQAPGVHLLALQELL